MVRGDVSVPRAVSEREMELMVIRFHAEGSIDPVATAPGTDTGVEETYQ